MKSRCYWIVSQNVKNDETTVAAWSDASIRYHVAFMGWGFDDRRHLSGMKFANTQPVHLTGVSLGDRILIARRHKGEPEVVGVGIVEGKYRKALNGFDTPRNKPFGSLRKLKWFKPCSVSPPSILSVVLPRNRSLTQLHPDKHELHKKLCKWIDANLGRKNWTTNSSENQKRQIKHNRNLASQNTESNIPKHDRFDYPVWWKAKSIRAIKKEAKLLKDYQDWLRPRGRKIVEHRYKKGLKCDGYENGTKNLIEAKSSTERDHIRMAVGQLLDYAFFEGRNVRHKAILLPEKPSDDIMRWLEASKISVVWPEKGDFRDNTANGQFGRGTVDRVGPSWGRRQH